MLRQKKKSVKINTCQRKKIYSHCHFTVQWFLEDFRFRESVSLRVYWLHTKINQEPLLEVMVTPNNLVNVDPCARFLHCATVNFSS